MAESDIDEDNVRISIVNKEDRASDSNIELQEAFDPYFAPLYHVYDNCFYATEAYSTRSLC